MIGSEALTVIVLLLGAIVGGLVTWLIARGREQVAFERGRNAVQLELVALQERFYAAENEAKVWAERFAELTQEVVQLRVTGDAMRDERGQLAERAGRLANTESALHEAVARAAKLQSTLAESMAVREVEKLQAQEQLVLLQEAKQQLADQFKNLANEIFEDKSKRFTEQNQTNMGALLEPMRERLKEFQQRVEETYNKESQQRFSLEREIKRLAELNAKMSTDAENLTKALTGSSKTQGTWGEVVLESILDISGLRKGEQYLVQSSFDKDDGTRVQPDIVIALPEARQLVIDAKVSLLAYTRYIGAETDAERERELKRHIDSVREHIKSLSSKNYHALYDLKSVDFVLMFVPVEPAFMVAVSADKELFAEAWRRNVMLVSPSTLLAVLRVVAMLWRQEQQNRNAQEIAKRGAELYNKLAGFTGDLEKLGDRLRMAQESYDSALTKFSRGRGNVIRQAEMLKELGVKPDKELPSAMLDTDETGDVVVPITKQAASLSSPGSGDALDS